MAVADDEAILRFLIRLPAEKRQPNLLFAAAATCSMMCPVSRTCVAL
jgi:hypothetical protein